jgi:organic radical activating enzyme|tara:strand:+ start:1161 stop:2327 length:1167 start_codon:yes stop_codon:yes gene_type:complete
MIRCTELETSYDINLIGNTFAHCCKWDPIIVDHEEINKLGYRYFDKNKETLQARSDLKNNIKTSRCIDCWREEDAGTMSWRQMKNNEYYSSSIKINIQIFSNCNQSCFYCVPTLSSGIQKYNKWIDKDTGDFSFFDDENTLFDFTHIIDFVKNIDKNKKFLELGISGGEPFINFNIFLENIVEIIKVFNTTNDRWITLNISTNSNVKPNNLLLFYDKINKLKEKYKIDVIILTSIENIEERAEYVRYGLDWDNFLENFKIHTKHAKYHLIRMTLNPFSIVNISDFFKYFYSKFNIHKILYNYPFQKFWRINVLDNRFIKEIKKLEDTTLNSSIVHEDTKFWIRTLRKDISNNRYDADIFRKAITNMDEIKGTNWRTVFPEYIEWFDNE